MIFQTFVEEGAREKGNNTGIRGETLRNRGASGEEDKGDKRTEDKGTRIAHPREWSGWSGGKAGS